MLPIDGRTLSYFESSFLNIGGCRAQTGHLSPKVLRSFLHVSQ